MNLSIKDLSASTELDSAAMSAVHGGDNGNSGVNTIFQQLGMSVPVGIVNGAGSASNNFINVNGTQDASIDNEQTSGDKFAAFLAAVRG